MARLKSVNPLHRDAMDFRTFGGLGAERVDNRTHVLGLQAQHTYSPGNNGLQTTDFQ